MSKVHASEAKTQEYLERYMEGVKKRNPGEPEFVQAVLEVASSIFPYISDKPIYHEMQILERMAEPERVVSFRVPWTDDEGNIRTNRGFRVQFNSAIGPYKGGIRFHPSVNQSILKFLGFEQTFKNSLTGLPMGGGKGGANFNPKGKSDNEVMRFCQSFVTELYRHIGEDTDVPAGDIGVGGREIGFMFGQYKRITNRFVGVLTGKGLEFGGSKMRTEATGYGAVFFLRNMLEQHKDTMEGKRVLISGSGNVATHAAEKCLHLGATPITMSDSGGFIHCPDGFTQEQIDWIKDLKTVRRGRISEAADEFDKITFGEGRPWGVEADCAVPSATQNEVSPEEAAMMIKNGVKSVAEAANMPCEQGAVENFQEAGVLFGPAKAVNAGGVGVSGLEMSQNSARIAWDEDRLRQLLEDMMKNIHDSCVQYGEGKDGVDYLKGSNIAGFVKVADAMLSYGHV
ncbi:MAG: NADP-specific glutamate dehydrogenase [Rhodospirillaceae bacterium]|nr:NADP-specific glutamate dehydrogenase [Rhodospirillaceae bacterium]HAA93506.1 NADP-specific glutamate dehydrogenase [Rhodospirillaceae bacterium]